MVEGGGGVADGGEHVADLVQADREVALGFGGGDALGELFGDVKAAAVVVEGGGGVADGGEHVADLVQADREVALGFWRGDTLGLSLLQSSRFRRVLERDVQIAGGHSEICRHIEQCDAGAVVDRITQDGACQVEGGHLVALVDQSDNQPQCHDCGHVRGAGSRRIHDQPRRPRPGHGGQIGRRAFEKLERTVEDFTRCVSELQPDRPRASWIWGGDVVRARRDLGLDRDGNQLDQEVEHRPQVAGFALG